MKKILTAMLTLVTLIGFNAPAAFADTAFKPQLVGTVTITQANDQIQKWALDATGSQAPLGDFVYHSDLVVQMNNGVPQSAQGNGTFTGIGASSGDSISFHLELQFSSPTTGPYPFPFTGTFTVINGTGRFKGLKGGGTIPQGGANPTAGTFFGNWDGIVHSSTF